MTKEQFIKFKQDFKNVVEVTKIQNKYRKAWWNLGFKTEEEYKHVKSLDISKISSLRKNVLKDELGYQVLNGESAITHWTYYCVKHRLEKSEIETYIDEEFKKMRIEK